MKLDRNANDDGGGKYALLKIRVLNDMRANSAFEDDMPPEISAAIKVLAKAGVIDWGARGTESEFFVIKLKDENAGRALFEYASSAEGNGDKEYADEVRDMAFRAGPRSPFCKKPD